MKFLCSRNSRLRTAGAAALAMTALAAVTPGVAEAVPAKPGDRTVLISVRNDTSLRLKLAENDLSEGKWTSEPPKAIKAYMRGSFGSTSSKSTGGTEATVVYRTKYGEVEIYWDQPWATDSDYTCEAPDELTCETQSSGATKTKVIITITED